MQAARSVGQRKKRIGEVVSYALSHRTRNHMRELADCGSIELVKSEPRRNMMQHYYTAVQMPCYTEEDMKAMTPEQRDVTYGLVIQSLAAEMMAALWNGTLSSDPKTWITWLWFNVDNEGREDIAAEMQRSWDRCWEIQEESANRCIESREETRSILVLHGGFPRAKKSPGLPKKSQNCD